MVSAWLKGQKTQFSRQQSYVCRPCEHNRSRKRHSAFWIALYGYNWIVSLNECQELVLEMMTSVRNKQAFYQQGLIAMSFIQQPAASLTSLSPPQPQRFCRVTKA